MTQNGTAQIGENKAGRDVTVMNMSETGVGFSVTTEADISLGDRIRLTFSDSVDEPLISKHNETSVINICKPSRTLKHKYNFILTGNVVRFISQPDGKIQKVGCSFDEAVDSKQIKKYVYAKQ